MKMKRPFCHRSRWAVKACHGPNLTGSAYRLMRDSNPNPSSVHPDNWVPARVSIGSVRVEDAPTLQHFGRSERVPDLPNRVKVTVSLHALGACGRSRLGGQLVRPIGYPRRVDDVPLTDERRRHVLLVCC